jgi:5-methylthioadenosine/S-adenosylhomocysteine deaminase
VIAALSVPEKDLLLENIDTAFRQDSERSIEHGIDILVRNGEIVEIGEGLSGGEVVDCTDSIALPGLINCHTHTPDILTRGWSDDRPLFSWLDANGPVLEYAQRSDMRAGARLSVGLMLETGTTTINDMWDTYLVDEFEDMGIRALMGLGMAETGDMDPDLVREGIETNRAFIDDYRGHPSIHPVIPVHSVYRSTGDLLQTAHDIATTHDLPFHIHLSETRRENEDCLNERGVTPTRWLDQLGVLDHRGVLAHCVHLTQEDRAAITESGTGVAHCPSANLKLGSGIADIPSLERIPVGIGTDSAASNNSLNLLREGRTAALVHKRDDPRAITAQRILDMMTCEAATTLDMGDSIGSLEEGKRADIVLIERDDSALRPHFGDEGLLSNLIYSFHGQADMTIVDGKIVVESGSVVTDISTAIETVQKFCTTINERFGEKSSKRRED